MRGTCLSAVGSYLDTVSPVLALSFGIASVSLDLVLTKAACLSEAVVHERYPRGSVADAKIKVPCAGNQSFSLRNVHVQLTDKGHNGDLNRLRLVS